MQESSNGAYMNANELENRTIDMMNTMEITKVHCIFGGIWIYKRN